MNISNLVCSEETADKMKTKGFSQSSLYVWNYLTHNVIKNDPKIKIKYASAYLVDEVWELLPKNIDNYALHVKNFGPLIRAGYVDPMADLNHKAAYKADGFNLAEALCLLALQLVEEGEIKNV